VIGPAAALGLALAAQGQRPIRAACIDVRPLFVAVDLRGTIVARPSRGASPAYDLALERPICVDDGAPSPPLARVGVYATGRAGLARLAAHLGRRVRLRGQAFTTFTIARPRRANMVVNVRAIEAAAR
jgi:hypothetical protein